MHMCDLLTKIVSVVFNTIDDKQNNNNECLQCYDVTRYPNELPVMKSLLRYIGYSLVYYVPITVAAVFRVQIGGVNDGGNGGCGRGRRSGWFCGLEMRHVASFGHNVVKIRRSKTKSRLNVFEPIATEGRRPDIGTVRRRQVMSLRYFNRSKKTPSTRVRSATNDKRRGKTPRNHG